jgi:hypothetical protein
MFKTLLLAAMLLTATAAVAQNGPPQGPRRQGPPVVQCEEMKKLMKAVQDHRATCEVCKTNLPQRGQFGPGPRDGKGPRGPRGPQQGPPPPAPEK